MTEIEFKLVDGEPVCDARCPSMGLRGKHDSNILMHRDCGHRTVVGKSPCIPGLRQQRDEAQADLAEAQAAIGRVREWISQPPPPYSNSPQAFQAHQKFCAEIRALLTPAPATGKDGG